MEHHISSTDLQNTLLAETLQALSLCYSEIGQEVYVVGATARDIALRIADIPNVPRRTLDLDVAIALQNWEQFTRLTEILLQAHFEKAPEKQRFYYKGADGQNNYEVDIVPFGAVALNDCIAWPPEGSPVMSVRCFDDVMRIADKVYIDNLFSFRIAPLSGQFLIKLDTWQDRHLSTKKDAADMVYILQNVYTAYALSHTDFPAEISIDIDNFDVIVAGAEWMATELKSFLSSTNRTYYAQLLLQEYQKEENSRLLNDMLDAAGGRYYALFRQAFLRIAQILEQ